MHSQHLFDAPADEPVWARVLTRYREFALVLLGGLLGVLATLATFFLQRSHDVRMAEAQRIEQHVVAAVSALAEIGGALDAVTAAGARLGGVARDTLTLEDLGSVAAAVDDARTEWLKRRNRARLLASVYFGDSVEAEVQRADAVMARIDEHLRNIRYAQRRIASLTPGALATPAGQEYSRGVVALHTVVREEMAAWSSSVFALERAMAAFIQSRQVGSFDPLANLGAHAPLRPTPWPTDSVASAGSRQ